jgi:MFS family permease
MEVSSKWPMLGIQALPLAWLIAFLSFVRFSVDLKPVALPALAGLLLGLLVTGVLADLANRRLSLLLVIQAVPLLFGLLQLFLPPAYLLTQQLLVCVVLLFFCLGASLVLVALLLNQITSAVHRGRVAGLYSMLVLATAGGLSLVWGAQFAAQLAVVGLTSALLLFGYMSAGTALLFLIGLLVIGALKPWRKHAQTYMVPGSIRPYLAWWVIYSLAFALYSLATPLKYRFLFLGFPIPPFSAPVVPRYPTELVWAAVGFAALVFAFFPDWLGRKKTRSIASFLLGEVCIFASARDIVGAGLSDFIAVVLMASEVLVLGFVLGVGGWLVWAEVGSVRFKGRRAAAGWFVVAVVLFLIWMSSVVTGPIPPPEVLYATAATLVLASLFPLTNAVEPLFEERPIEELQIRVDAHKVNRAIREIEVETPLKSVRDQIETELGRLARIPGVTRSRARQLTSQGYDTPELVARAEPAALAETLGISEEEALRIKAGAQKLVASESHHGIKDAAQQKARERKKPKG